jgi:hypothetical protein
MSYYTKFPSHLENFRAFFLQLLFLRDTSQFFVFFLLLLASFLGGFASFLEGFTALFIHAFPPLFFREALHGVLFVTLRFGLTQRLAKCFSLQVRRRLFDLSRKSEKIYDFGASNLFFGRILKFFHQIWCFLQQAWASPCASLREPRRVLLRNQLEPIFNDFSSNFNDFDASKLFFDQILTKFC